MSNLRLLFFVLFCIRIAVAAVPPASSSMALTSAPLAAAVVTTHRSCEVQNSQHSGYAPQLQSSGSATPLPAVETGPGHHSSSSASITASNSYPQQSRPHMPSEQGVTHVHSSITSNHMQTSNSGMLRHSAQSSAVGPAGYGSEDHGNAYQHQSQQAQQAQQQQQQQPMHPLVAAALKNRLSPLPQSAVSAVAPAPSVSASSSGRSSAEAAGRTTAETTAAAQYAHEGEGGAASAASRAPLQSLHNGQPDQVSCCTTRDDDTSGLIGQ